jgi:hypothetical protein
LANEAPEASISCAEARVRVGKAQFGAAWDIGLSRDEQYDLEKGPFGASFVAAYEDANEKADKIDWRSTWVDEWLVRRGFVDRMLLQHWMEIPPFSRAEFEKAFFEAFPTVRRPRARAGARTKKNDGLRVGLRRKDFATDGPAAVAQSVGVVAAERVALRATDSFQQEHTVSSTSEGVRGATTQASEAKGLAQSPKRRSPKRSPVAEAVDAALAETGLYAGPANHSFKEIAGKIAPLVTSKTGRRCESEGQIAALAKAVSRHYKKRANC